MLWLLLFCLLLLQGSNGQEASTSFSRLFDALRVSLRIASTFFNSSPEDVLPKVLENFGQLHENVGGLGGLVQGILKLIGVDHFNAGTYAFNGVILLTHLISIALIQNDAKSREERSGAEFSPIDYIINQPQVQSLLTQIEDTNLVETALAETQDKLQDFPPEDIECILLLMCKISPFVREMQNSLKFFANLKNGRDTCINTDTKNNETCHTRNQWEQTDIEGRMFFFVPSLEEVLKHGDNCDFRFPNCVY